MKIGNFNISKKTIIIVVVVILFIVIASMVSESARQQEIADRNAAIDAEQNANSDIPTTELTDEELEQQALNEAFGEPPEGFKWDDSGNLVAIGTDELNAEQILYTYIRALSILDFSTAQRYSSHSSIIDGYNRFYEDSAYMTDYYDNFLRQQFKTSLTTIEINGVSDTAVFADGKKIVTVNVSVLDLTDKDFWREDRDKLFDTLFGYKYIESDDVKFNKAIYEYILESYEDGSISKRTYDIEFVVTKQQGGGWLISDDQELYSIISYEEGMDIALYIQEDFYEWYDDAVEDYVNGTYGDKDVSDNIDDESTELPEDSTEFIDSTEGI